MNLKFTPEEQEFLVENDWDLSHDNKVAEKNWSRILKRSDFLFEVQTCITDPDSNDYWEWDREESDLSRAILHRA